MNSKKPLFPNVQYHRYTGLLSQPAPATNPLPALIGVSFWRLAPVPSNPLSLVIFHFVSSLLTRQLHTDRVIFIFRFFVVTFLRFVSCFFNKSCFLPCKSGSVPPTFRNVLLTLILYEKSEQACPSRKSSGR